MSPTVVIHQPDFAPYLGFFQRFLHADLYIVLDHVQFATRGWTHRDKIKGLSGEKWVSLSVKKSPRGTPINEVELVSEREWVDSNLALLHENYRNALYFNEIIPHAEALYQNPPRLMQDFNLRWLEWLMDALEVRIPSVLSSSLQPQGQKNELLIDLLGKVGASRYLSGTGARDYLELEKFSTAGVDVIWQKFEHPIYPQQFGAFIPYLSVLDVLFNCGITGTRVLLESSK